MNMHCTRLILILLLLLASGGSALRARQGDDTPTPLPYGEVQSGTLNNRSPRALYIFEGLRGERVAIELRAVSGDLDPVLVVLDASGAVIATRDDTRGSRDASIELSIPRSGIYTVIVGRFGYGQGSTSGSYELRIDRIGVSSASGSMLRYGDSVLNSIDNLNPQVYYSFRAAQGDIVNIRMQRTSGNLDPYLQVVDSSAYIIAENDDLPASGTLDAAVEGLVIQQSGVFVIVATRFGQTAGNTVGTFVLTLEEADDSGLGNSPRAALPIAPGISLEGSISSERYEQFYRFEAQQDDIITIRMERQTGSLDCLIVLTDANLTVLAENDDLSSETQNSRISEFRIPLTGTYFIIASRYQREAGSSAGIYRLMLDVQGNAFAGVPPDVQRIAFGSTITGRIDSVTPQVVYAFYAQAGESFTISMSRGDGDLNPVVAVLDANQRVLAEGDSDGQTARIDRFTAANDSVYYIRAGRQTDASGTGSSSGSYLLVIARRAD